MTALSELLQNIPAKLDRNTLSALIGLAKAIDAGGGGAVLSTAKISLTSAQLLALNTSPVEIIAAPGTGKYIAVIQSVYNSLAGATPYAYADGSNGNGLFYGGADGAGGDGTDNQVFANASSAINVGTGGLGSALTNVENLPLLLTDPAGNMTAGDGTGSITVLYSIIDL